MLFWIAIGAGIATFGIHNIHERTGITEGGVIDDAVHPSLVWFAGWLDYTGADVSCYLLALRFLGTRFIKVSILSTFCVSTFYNLWELFPYLLPDLSDYPLAAAVFGGIFVGIGVGLIVRQGGSSGGDDALALLFQGDALAALPLLSVHRFSSIGAFDFLHSDYSHRLFRGDCNLVIVSY